jgi:phage-related baseplate assembly protein
LVTTEDLTGAAKEYSDLGVRRAAELTGDKPLRRPMGTRILIAVGPRDPNATSQSMVESREWLEEIRRRLAPRMPLGQRLEVVAPREVSVRVTARIIAVGNADPEVVKAAAEKTLRDQFAAVATEPGGSEWPLGRDVTRLAVKGRLRKVDGVARIVDLQVGADGQEPAEEIVIGPTGLARLVLDPADIVVERNPQRPSR